MPLRGYRIVVLLVGIFSIVGLGFGSFYFYNRQTNYCSMLNGCPSDKCVIKTECSISGNGDPNGCAPGPQTCEYKDSVLKTAYSEISMQQTAQCVSDFLNRNAKDYPIFEKLEIDYDVTKENPDTCGEESTNDKYCRYITLKHKSGQFLPYYASFDVGAQTCAVYWNVPEAFKTLSIETP